ncbi:hypothetical protein BDR26DRAFT_877381 [Obelidium mucronatum]|nr:hypothetical protein BDR26DRAFT_877381 [Obelidium mucronatum]
MWRNAGFDGSLFVTDNVRVTAVLDEVVGVQEIEGVVDGGETLDSLPAVTLVVKSDTVCVEFFHEAVGAMETEGNTCGGVGLDIDEANVVCKDANFVAEKLELKSTLTRVKKALFLEVTVATTELVKVREDPSVFADILELVNAPVDIFDAVVFPITGFESNSLVVFVEDTADLAAEEEVLLFIAADCKDCGRDALATDDSVSDVGLLIEKVEKELD